MGQTNIKFNLPKGPFAPLSNQYDTYFDLDDKSWSTIDHYYYAKRVDSPYFQENIRVAQSPETAKDLSNKRENMWLPNWQEIHLSVMKVALQAKFSQNKDLMKLLKSTKPHQLTYEFNDPILGNGKDGEGQNELGKMLMEIRDN